MKTLMSAFAALALFSPVLAFANTNTNQVMTSSATSNSCSAQEIEQYYCPTTGGWWYGPYFDNGCSVTCEAGQTASCSQATCAQDQTGEAIPSDCHCN